MVLNDVGDALSAVQGEGPPRGVLKRGYQVDELDGLSIKHLFKGRRNQAQFI